MRTDHTGRTSVSSRRLALAAVTFLLVFGVAISIVAASSNPDPTDVAPGSQSLATSIVNSAVIVFREGLEAVLIFAAITASFLGDRQRFRRPVLLGVAAAFVATVLTWIVVQAILGAVPVDEDILLAATGITAIVVLLLVMNWFFHKVYWTEHIGGLNARKRALVDESEAGGGAAVRFWGFVALGFTAVYREGFEVVLFLQNLELVAGTAAVLWGVLFGLAGTAVVGFLTFFLHHRLPYRRMLVLTGVLLGMVLVVMVGGSARTLQSLGWIPTTPLGVQFPDWWARWFELVPTVETVLLQVLAAAFVIGSYYAAEWWSKEKRRRRAAADASTSPEPQPRPIAIPGAGVGTSPAAARGAAFAARPGLRPTTVCGRDATTLCGADARTAIAAAVPGSHVAVRPTTLAPAFTPRPLFAERPGEHAAARLADRPPLQLPRLAFAPPHE